MAWVIATPRVLIQFGGLWRMNGAGWGRVLVRLGLVLSLEFVDHGLHDGLHDGMFCRCFSWFFAHGRTSFLAAILGGVI